MLKCLKKSKTDKTEKDVCSLDAGSAVRLQTELLGRIQAALDSSLQNRRGLGGGDWLAGLHKNVWQGGHELRLQHLVEEFRVLHELCASDDTGTGLFEQRAIESLDRSLPDLLSVVEEATPRKAWDALFKFGKNVTKATTELLQGKKEDSEPDPVWRARLVTEFKERLGEEHRWPFVIAFRLRCRDAHGEAPEKVGEWRRLQNKIAERLSRSKPRHMKADRKFWSRDDLQLSGLEATEFKIDILEGICAALRSLKAAE